MSKYNVTERVTKWGEMVSVYDDANFRDPVAEVMVFDKEGRNHEHDEYEIATCIRGTGLMKVPGYVYSMSPGRIVVVPPNTLHHMVPDDPGGFEFVIWYSETEPAISLREQS